MARAHARKWRHATQLLAALLLLGRARRRRRARRGLGRRRAGVLLRLVVQQVLGLLRAASEGARVDEGEAPPHVAPPAAARTRKRCAAAPRRFRAAHAHGVADEQRTLDAIFVEKPVGLRIDLLLRACCKARRRVAAPTQLVRLASRVSERALGHTHTRSQQALAAARMSPRACIAVALLATASSSSSSSSFPRAPLFSLSSVPVYQHLAAVNTSGFPAARAAWLARRYPLVVIEHVQDQGYLFDAPPSGAKCWGPEPFAPPTAFFEDAAAAAAAQIKALNETAIVLYYANANSGLPWYHLASALGASAHGSLSSLLSPRTAASSLQSRRKAEAAARAARAAAAAAAAEEEEEEARSAPFSEEARHSTSAGREEAEAEEEEAAE